MRWVMLTAWPVGIALGLLTHLPVAEAQGWAAVMHLTAVVAVVAPVLTAAFYRAPPAIPGAGNAPLRFGLPRREMVHTSVVGLAWTLFNASIIVTVSFAPDALVAAGRPADSAHGVTSLFMWVTLVSLPLGGRLMETLGYITPAITVTLLAAAAVVVPVAWGASPALLFVLFGLLVGAPGGALMVLSAEAILPEHRGPGLGVFYTWYYLGMTVAPAVAGWLRDATGSPRAPVLFAAGLLVVVVACVAVLRLLQARWPIGETS